MTVDIACGECGERCRVRNRRLPCMDLMSVKVMEWGKWWGLVGEVGLMIVFASAFVIVVWRGVVLEV